MLFEDFGYRVWGDAQQLGHRHQNANSYEIIQVLSDGGSALISDRTYRLTHSAVLFIDANYLHSVKPEPVSSYCRNKLRVDGQYLRRLFEAMDAQALLDEFYGGQGGTCLVLEDKQSQQLDRLFCRMADALEETDSAVGQLYIHALLMEMFSLCGRYSKPVTPHEQDKLSPVLDYLRAHYTQPLTVEEIARDIHLSKYYLCHLFREKTGMTLMHYLYEYRLSVARQQLRFSQRSISEIALSCGFRSSSHFCAIFRRHEGIAPRDYRKNALHEQ